jgi:hypothetical protein
MKCHKCKSKLTSVELMTNWDLNYQEPVCCKCGDGKFRSQNELNGRQLKLFF